MADYPKELEIDRLMNVVKTFGWEKIREEQVGTDVIITIKKTIHEESEITEVTPS